MEGRESGIFITGDTAAAGVFDAQKGVFDLTVQERVGSYRLVPLCRNNPPPPLHSFPKHPHMFKSSLPICFAFSSVSTRPLKSRQPKPLNYSSTLKKRHFSIFGQDLDAGHEHNAASSFMLLHFV